MFSKVGPLADSPFELGSASSGFRYPTPLGENRAGTLCAGDLATLLEGEVGSRPHIEEFLRPLVQRCFAWWLKRRREPEELHCELWLALIDARKAGDAPRNLEALAVWLRRAFQRVSKGLTRSDRAERRRAVLLAGRDPEAASSSSDPSLKPPERPRLEDILRLLPRPDWRFAFRRRACDPPWPSERIARHLGVNSDTVRTWTLRSRRFLQRLPQRVLRSPTDYAVIPQGRGYAVVPRNPVEATGTART